MIHKQKKILTCSVHLLIQITNIPLIPHDSQIQQQIEASVRNTSGKICQDVSWSLSQSQNINVDTRSSVRKAVKRNWNGISITTQKYTKPYGYLLLPKDAELVIFIARESFDAQLLFPGDFSK